MKGYLVEVKEEGVTRYEYDKITHLVTKEILPNGIITSYRYDEDSQVVDVLHQDCQGKLILHYEYDYDKQGNCIFIQEETPEQIKNTQCEYDLLDRLILEEYKIPALRGKIASRFFVQKVEWEMGFKLEPYKEGCETIYSTGVYTIRATLKDHISQNEIKLQQTFELLSNEIIDAI